MAPPFVDVHSHVVPSGDDGAATLEEGLALCRIAVEAGTRVLFATPHVHAPWDTYPLTPARRDRYLECFPALRGAAAEIGLDLRRGWELFPTELLDTDPSDFRLEGTDAVLVEFPGWWLDFAAPLEAVVAAGELVEAAGLVPVLAHPERCPAVTAAPHVVAELADRGWLMCLNAPSLTGGHGATAERTAWRLVEDGAAGLVASDGHTARRPPRLDEAWALVVARYGAEAAAPLFDGSALPWR